MIPVVSYVNENTSVLIADNGIHFYKGTQKPEEITRVEFKKEIQSVAYGDELIAILARNDRKADYKLHIYNLKGKLLSAVDVDKEYSKMQVTDGQIILYDGQSCSIHMKNGVKKYEGNIDQNIMEVFKLSGLNKYMVINANGFYEVRLAK